MKEPIIGVTLKHGELVLGKVQLPPEAHSIIVPLDIDKKQKLELKQAQQKKSKQWKENRKQESMKVLCLCAGGAVRSVTLAFVLKYEYKIDAIAASLEKNSENTLKMLYEWADRIIVVQVGMEDNIPVEYLEKTLCLDIGPDRWGASLHKELLNICGNLLEQAFAGKSTYKE